MKRHFLMIPGPIEMDPDILAEMSAPLVVHYGPEWVRFFQETTELVKKVFRAESSDLWLMAGPGSAAIEAAISSLVADGSKMLAMTNGFFGERWWQVSRTYTQHVCCVEAPWGRPLDPDDVRSVLRREKDMKAAVVVHGETSTGVLNPLREIAQICHEHGVILIVDAVSTLGGVPLEVDAWKIGLCAAATQKCLECPPGLAPISVSPEAWKQIENSSSPGWYLNLRTWKEFSIRWGDWHPHPVTMPSGLVRALHKSCRKILTEGLEARFARHARLADLLRRGLENLGCELLVPESDYQSNTVTAVRAHARIAPAELIRYLKEKHGILISGGLDRLAGKIFRIGHMGPTATPNAILPTLYGIEEALREAGAKVEPGQCLRGLPTPVLDAQTSRTHSA